MAVELANAYINIIPSTKDIAPAVKDALKDLDPVAHKSGTSLGSKISHAMTKTLKLGAASAGTAVAGVFGTSLAKGFSRMNATSNATAKLKALGNDAQDVAGIMDNALASVKGTAFGIGEAAGTASTLVAAGIKPGQELQGVLDAVADTASVAGTSMEDMGFIFGKAAAKGKLDGEVVAQLLERQIPVYDILSQKTGAASADIADMVSKGKIDFQTFSDAMTDYVGGGARVMADTFDGSLMNMGAAMGRFGEALEQPLYNAAPGFFKAVTGLFDDLTAAIKPAMTVVGDLLTPAFRQLGTVIETKLSPFMATLATQFGDLAVKLTTKVVDPALWERVGDVFSDMKDTFAELWPSVQSLGASFLTISKNISVATWEALTATLNALAPLIQSVLVPLVEKTAEFADQHPGAIQAIVMAFLGFKAVQKPVAAATGAIKSLSGAISILKSGEGVVKALSSLGGVGAKLASFMGTMSKFASTASKVAGFVVKGLTFVNPWVAGIAAVTGALTLFFTKTETGRQLWSDFMGALSGGLDFLVEKFSGFGEWWSGVWDGLSTTVSGAWEPTQQFFVSSWEAMQPAIAAAGDFFASVWNGIVTVAQWAFAIIATAVLTPLVLAWEAMSWAVQAAWVNVIKPTWNALAAGAQWMWNTVLMPTFEFIKDGWQALGDAIQWTWVNVIKPAWGAVAAMATWLWQNALQPAFDGIVAGWNALGDAIQWTYQNVIQPAWDLLVAGVNAMWDRVNIVFGWIQAGWQALGDGLRWVYDNIIQPVWDAFGAGLTWLHDSVVVPVTGWIGEKWHQLGDGMNTVKTFVVDTVFGGLKSGLDAVQGWFNSIVDAIGHKWNELRGHLARPINFMINTVYNDGILRAWNVIAGILPGLNKGDRLAGIPGYAIGGRIKGPGTGTSDDILAWLSNGEHVWTAREVQAIGGHNVLDALRDAILHRRGFTFDGAHATLLPGRVNNRVGDLAGAAPDLLPKFARGGRVDDKNVRPLWELQLVKAHEFARAQHGKPYQWAGPTGPGSSFDCSGFMGAIAATIQGTNPWQRYWATMSFPSPGAQGFVPGLAAGFSVGMFNGGPWGGHTAGTLSAAGPYSAVNVESGGSPSMVKYGVGAAGADHPQFTMHYHLPIGADGGFVSGGTGGVDPEAMRSRIAETLNKAINVVMDPIKGQLPAPPPAWMGIPGAVFDAGQEGLVNFVDDGVKALGDGLGTVFTAVSNGAKSLIDSGRDTVGAAMDFLGARVFDRGGVLRKGQMAVNLGNADEHVISEKSFQNFRFAAETLQAAADEIRVAFDGGDFGYGALAEVLRNEQWAKAIVDGAAQLGKIADYNSLEGVAARSFASEMSDIVGMLGGKTVSTVATSLLGAEKDIWDAREGYASRAADIAEKEKALEEARKAAAKLSAESPELSVKDQRKLADAEEALARARKDAEAASSSTAKSEEARAKAKEKSDQKVADAEKNLARVREDIGIKEGETAEKRAEDIQKANEQVVKAEQELAAARKASAKALDMRIFDVAPQINGMLVQAAAATTAVPAVSQALAGLAAAAGPAGVSVGVAVAALKTAVSTFTEIAGAIDQFAQRVRGASIDAWRAIGDMFGAVAQFQDMVQGLREQVTSAVIAFGKAQLDLAAAQRNMRIVAMDGVTAQLKGVKSLREAQAALDKHMGKSASTWKGYYIDLTYGANTLGDQLEANAQRAAEALQAWDDEAMALLFDVKAQEMNLILLQQQAQLANLEAAYKYEQAVLDSNDAMRNLLVAVAKFDAAARAAFGMDATEATVGQRYAELQVEKAQLQADQASFKTWINPVNWFTSMPAAQRRIRQIDDQLAEIAAMPEFKGLSAETLREVDSLGRKATMMGLFGAGDRVQGMVQNSALGDAQRALDEVKFQQSLIDLRNSQAELKSTIDHAALELAYRRESEPLQTQIQATEMLKARDEAMAEYWRSDSRGVRDAIDALAQNYQDNARELNAIASKQRDVTIQVPAGKTAFDIAEVNDLVRQFNAQIEDVRLRLDAQERAGRANGLDVSALVRG